jgi:DNA polymerase III subunit epsilon
MWNHITNLLVLDLETSGVNPFQNDVLAVGLVPFHRPELARTIYVRPTEVHWNEYARRNFAKFEAAWERGAVPPGEACAQVEAYVDELTHGKSATLIGHNIGFDQAFLRKLAFAGGRDQLRGISHRALDTHTLLYLLHAAGKLPADAVSSDGAFRHFAIEVPESERHTAVADALATRKLFKRLLERLGDEHTASAE